MTYHDVIEEIWLRRIATTHENTLMDVGKAISSVAEEKYALVSTSSPTVNM